MSLNSAQYEAVAHREGPCMVLAGPGSGKTLTIAKRIEYLIKKYEVRPEEILVITFTKYAANEMRNRFYYLMKENRPGVTFGTFHGIYYGILKWAYGIGQSNLLSGEEKFRLLRQILSEDKTDEQLSREEEKEFLQSLSEEIGNIKNNRADIDKYEALVCKSERFREIYHAYETAKKKLRKIDFEDMLLLCYELFSTRPDILKKWQQKYRYILVDEFQDINQVQYDVVKMLAAPGNNLFVVGDDDQSVYGFRGARPGIMMAFRQEYPDAKKVILNVNYRSSSHIVKGAMRVIAHNEKRFEKEIRANQKPGEVIHVQEVKNPLEESQYVIGQIKILIEKGISYNQIAVLYRTTLNARTISESFMEYQIPFCMREHMENIYDHFIARDFISYFHMIQGEAARKDFLQVANRPNRYIGRDSMTERSVTFESLRNFYCDKDWMLDRIDQMEWDVKMMKKKSPYLAIQYIRKRMGYDEFLKEYAQYRHIQVEDLFAVLEEIQERAKEFETLNDWFLHIREYEKLLGQQMHSKKSSQEGVELLTMHTAKGLEYDTVFIIQSNEDVIPYKKAKAAEEIEEERRLFYVAMTRAKRKLIISYVKEKNGKDLSPSRFVNELLLV